MKLQIHSIRFDADEKLIRYIEKKMDKLSKFHRRVVDGEVILKLNNSSIENKTVEIKLNIPGLQLFSREKSRAFERGLDLATASIKRQLKKHKEKQIAH